MPDNDDDMNPRERGFNYNTGWGSDPKPQTYYYAMAIVALWLKELQEQSQKVWHAQMICRDVNLAYTCVEKARALAALDDWIAQL